MHFLYSSFFRKLFKQFCSLPIDTACKLCYRAIMSAFIFTKADTVTMYVIYCFSRHCNCIFLEVMAVGDSGNDLSMIEDAGLGVAMGNATPEILAAADAVTADNNHDGVALAIEKYALHR